SNTIPWQFRENTPEYETNFFFARTVEAINFWDATVSRSAPARTRERSAPNGSHGHGHPICLRCADAIGLARERTGIPAAHNKKVAHQIDRLRAALVFAR